jgi:hypothetical protein
MHGLPLAWAKFERKNVPGLGWRIAVTGQNEIVRATYAENANRSQLTFAEPGFYLVVVQTDTAQAQTELELETPTDLALNTLGRWIVGSIVQPISVVPAANGLADPVVQTLNRVWMPFERVSMAWPIQTTTADQPVRWRWASGQSSGQHTPTIYAWRLFNYAGGIGKTQDANRIWELPTITGPAAAVRLDPPSNPWYDPTKLDWYRVTASATQAGTKLRWEVETLHDYEHLWEVAVRSTPGTQASGSIGFRVLDAMGATIASTTLNYQPPNETFHSQKVDRRSSNQRVAAVEVFDIDQTDACDVRVVLNVND